jgi:hypothetical protein
MNGDGRIRFGESMTPVAFVEAKLWVEPGG